MLRTLPLIILITSTVIKGHSDVDARQKRQIVHSPLLIFPFGGTFKLVVGFAMPVELPGRTLVYGTNFQFQYLLPQNSTFFTDYFRDFSSRRQQRNAFTNDKQILYQLLEHEYEKRNMNGTDCLKRSICEAASVMLEEEGLVGELLHVLLTPDHGGILSVHQDYFQAAMAGRRNDDCSRLYPFCLVNCSILDWISKVAM